VRLFGETTFVNANTIKERTMNKIITLATISIIATAAFCEDTDEVATPPVREGFAIGYLTTPNSVVFRVSLSENTAGDFWVDVPDIDFGDFSSLTVGTGAGYAMFPIKNPDFALMVRPQASLRYYNSDAEDYGEIAFGATGTVVAYLDNIGLPNGDIYAGVSLGTTIEMRENSTVFRGLLSKRGPFGIVIGMMYYF
jgi:hypothetical protein